MTEPVEHPHTHIGDIGESQWREAFEDEDPRLPPLLNARRMLRHAELGLEDLLNADEPERRELGFYSVVVYGRSVTIAAQNFRTNYESGFNEWYVPFEMEMREDELMLYFNKMRNTLLKDVPPPILDSPAPNLSSQAQADLFRFIDETPKPEGATQFRTNILGGSGWEVPQADGTARVVEPVPLPDYLRRWYLRRSHLPNAPHTHGGRPIAERDLQGLCTLYVEWLRRFVARLGTWADHLEELPLDESKRRDLLRRGMRFTSPPTRNFIEGKPVRILGADQAREDRDGP